MSNYIHHEVCYEITYPFPTCYGGTDQVWESFTDDVLEWISKLIPNFTGLVISYPCWD